MVYKIVILPDILFRGNFNTIWDRLLSIPAFKIEKFTNISCRKNGVCRDGEWIMLEGETVEFIIHPDSGITQEDIDVEPDDRSFGNGFSTFAFNGKKCCIVVLQRNQTIPIAAISTQLLNDVKRKDKIKD